MSARHPWAWLSGYAIASDRRGTAVIEMAIIAPVLVLLTLGSFDVSAMISRQNELQSGAAQAEAIALAANAGASTDTAALKSLLMSSLKLGTDQVEIIKLYRCGTNSGLVSTGTSCGTNVVVSSYVRVRLQDAYKPMWTRFGFSKTFNFNIVRTVQLS
ncbi:TadE/TadG family type IV pilus assembly protein [Novosphingobium sp. PY1]|uniref:TadE-like domain-containing protein n=1 Tax=Ochrobactrum sp. PW1 TaxID=1882222 RepID=A0A292GS03_9HYPH|nr:TadE/TadG family type IV pilus assembly protein [Novosphingobium sp. PY1]BBA74267.1 hypothetical protein [Ochrobactrum sp. PW1]GFM29116.1 uncharacterized protein PY1_contig-07-42 [Novosphingobium sp. PY1]